MKNITKTDKYENKQQFYDGAPNRHTKYKNWSWQNTKQTWTLLNTKPEHDKAHKTDMNITEIDKYKNEQQFYGGAQNRYENY